MMEHWAYYDPRIVRFSSPPTVYEVIAMLSRLSVLNVLGTDYSSRIALSKQAPKLKLLCVGLDAHMTPNQVIHTCTMVPSDVFVHSTVIHGGVAISHFVEKYLALVDKVALNVLSSITLGRIFMDVHAIIQDKGGTRKAVDFMGLVVLEIICYVIDFNSTKLSSVHFVEHASFVAESTDPHGGNHFDTKDDEKDSSNYVDLCVHAYGKAAPTTSSNFPCPHLIPAILQIPWANNVKVYTDKPTNQIIISF